MDARSRSLSPGLRRRWRSRLASDRLLLRMKILIVSNTYPPADISGVGSLAQELLEGLSDQAEIEVLTRTAPSGATRVTGTGGPKVLFPLLAAWKARLGSGGPAVVHVNESDGVVIALMIWLRRRLGLRTPSSAPRSRSPISAKHSRFARYWPTAL